jgi:ribosomal protein L21E
MLICYVVDEPEQWELFLPYVTFAYNTAVQTTLQECPFFLFFGRLPVLSNDIKLNFKYETTVDDAFKYTKKWMQAQRLARIHLFKAQEKPKSNYNLGTIETRYEVGDWVLLKAHPMVGKFINPWNGPFRITKSYSKVNYEIENLENKKQKRMVVNVNRLKKFNQRENNTTLTTPNNQQPKELNTETQKTGEKHTSIIPPTTTAKNHSQAHTELSHLKSAQNSNFAYPKRRHFSRTHSQVLQDLKDHVEATDPQRVFQC